MLRACLAARDDDESRKAFTIARVCPQTQLKQVGKEGAGESEMEGEEQ